MMRNVPQLMRTSPALFVALALAACASREVEPNQPAAPAPTTELELKQAPEHVAAPAEPEAESESKSNEDADEGQQLGMMGLLNTGEGDPDAPAAMWGDEIGESFAEGGLGLSGLSDGSGEGIGLGSIGTIGGAPPSSKLGPAPRVRMGSTQVTGKLPPEVIQRIVRQSFGRLRLCYEQGLKKDPNLEGKIDVHFVITREGKVGRVQTSGDLTDPSVVSCVSVAFRGLHFPEPDGGIVTVKYPIVFTPAASTGS